MVQTLLASIRTKMKPEAAFKYCITLSGPLVLTPACRQIRSSPQGLTPGRDRRAAFEALGDPQPGTLGYLGRQRGNFEKARGRNLAVRLGRPVLPELPDQIDRDVVAVGNVAVEGDSMQRRLPEQLDSALFRKLAGERIAEGFADLDAAARQMPARDIAVPDEKHAVLTVQHHAADPERHAAGEAPIEMEKPPQHRLKTPLQGLRVHCHRTIGYSSTVFDPCNAPARLSLH